MNPENIILSERSQSQKATWCLIPFICNVQKSKSTETESRLAIARGCGETGT